VQWGILRRITARSIKLVMGLQPAADQGSGATGTAVMR
jgi:hypothetical protein